MFAKITNGTVHKFPYSVGQLRRDNPNTSFPKIISEQTMAEYGVFPVSELPAPSFDSWTHYLEYNPVPVLQDGKWVTVPTVYELTQDQIELRNASLAKDIRAKRDTLLSATDWMALSDVVMSEAWANYRQALRDVTAQAGFPVSVVWPEKPAV